MDILIQYKELLSIVLVAIIEVVVLLIAKKRPQVIDNSILSHLMTWINEAESKYKVGSDKMAYVLSAAKKYLGDSYIEKQIRDMVELILSLPEKKEKK